MLSSLLSNSLNLNPSIVPTDVKVTYNYERDIPNKIRPHYRHAIWVDGNPPVTHEAATDCPCQVNQHLMPQDPLWPEEEKKQFWIQLHLMMPERDPAEVRRLQEEERQYTARKQEEEREYTARKQEEEREYTAQKQEEREYNARAWRENRAKDVDALVKVEAEMRAQREGEETAAESSAERAERDRQR